MGEAPWRARLSRLAVGLLVATVLSESALRISGVDSRWLNDLAFRQEADIEAHRALDEPEILYGLAPGAEADRTETGTSRRIAVNELGHRGPDRVVDKPADTLRIMAIGGSNTYGAAVSNGETWPDFLEVELNERLPTPVEVWNLGVSGYEMRQKVAVARLAIDRWEPDVLLFQVWNRGPRYVLEGDDASRWLTLSPELVDDWVPGLGAPTVRAALARRLALVRLPVLVLNQAQIS